MIVYKNLILPQFKLHEKKVDEMFSTGKVKEMVESVSSKLGGSEGTSETKKDQ
jgi:hypothetical protein